MSEVRLVAEPRTEFGKGSARRTRLTRSGSVRQCTERFTATDSAMSWSSQRRQRASARSSTWSVTAPIRPICSARWMKSSGGIEP